MGSELVTIMREQAVAFGASIVDANVSSVSLSQKAHIIRTDNTEYSEFETQALLIATGAKALWLGLAAETRLRGKGVSACATCDGFFFRNKQVAVVGGGDTALEEALQLTKFASKVYVIHRRDSFRASNIMRERVLKNEKIEVLWNKEVLDIFGQEKVAGIRLKDVVTNEVSEVKLEGVFVAIGHKPDTDLFKDQIILDKKGYIVTFLSAAERSMRKQGDFSASAFSETRNEPYYNSSTSVRGVFAAGDCVDYTYRQASTASGMGVAAALDIERFIEEQSSP